METVSQQLNKSLITGYNGDRSYAGASVNGKYNGVVSGDVTLVSGAKGYGLQFSPGCGQIKIDSLANFNWGSKFTVSLHIMRFPKTGYQSIISNGYCTTGSFEIRCGSESSLMYGGTINTKGDSQCWDTGILYLEKRFVWYHLAMTYDGATLKMYLDGSLVSTSIKNKGALKVSPYSLLIGQNKNSYGQNECFYGILDEIFLYSEVASQQDIAGLACFENYQKVKTNGTNTSNGGTNTNTGSAKANNGTNTNTVSTNINIFGTNNNTNNTKANTGGANTNTGGTNNSTVGTNNKTDNTKANVTDCVGNSYYDYDKQRCATCYLKDCQKCLGPYTCLYCSGSSKVLIKEENYEYKYGLFQNYSNLTYEESGKYYLSITECTTSSQQKHVDVIVLFWLILLASVIF